MHDFVKKICVGSLVLGVSVVFVASGSDPNPITMILIDVSSGLASGLDPNMLNNDDLYKILIQ